MDNLKVLTIGGSRNIGYYSSMRLLNSGATVTFLLRSPTAFANDQAIQTFVTSGKARLVQGDALVKEDVQRAWTEAGKGDDNRPVDLLVFTVGGTPQFKLTQGFVISPNLVTQALLNCLETLPTPTPKIVTISSTGLTRSSHKNLPLLLKLFYRYFLQVPHKDKCGAEEVLAHCTGWPWDKHDSAGPNILGDGWERRVPTHGWLKSLVVIRPALLTDGSCRADKTTSGKDAYRVRVGDVEGGWTISRKGVAHFLVEAITKHWDNWEGKCVSIAY